MSWKPRAVGIVLSGHLGDIVLQSSVLKPVRDRFPDAEVILIATRIGKDLFGDSPYIDRVVEAGDLHLGPWTRFRVPARKALAKLTRKLWMPSVAVDTLIFPWLFVSPEEVDLLTTWVKFTESVGHVGGLSIDSKSQFQNVDPVWESRITNPVRMPDDFQSSHLLDHIARFLMGIGCQIAGPGDLHVEIPIGPEDRMSAAHLTASFEGRSYGVVFPGASFNRDLKMWPLNRYADVVRLLADAGPRCWMVCGADAEREDCAQLAESIRRSCPGIETLAVCGEPLRRIAAALEGAQLVIGNDNGGMHMAVAIGRPTVSIVSGALEVLYFPWGDAKIHRAAMHRLDCWGCLYSCTQPRVICIEGISPEHVANECRLATAAPLDALGEFFPHWGYAGAS